MQEQKNPKNPILLVDDELNLLNSFELTLIEYGIDNTILCNDSRDVLDILKKNIVSLILLDLSMPHIRGEEILKDVVQNYPEVNVIIVTGDSEIETAVDCMKLGAFDYIVKPIEPNRLVNVINKALEIQRLKNENSSLKSVLITNNIEKPQAFKDIVTQSPKMKSMFQYMEAIAKTTEPILITGETGVGKELIARSLHILSENQGHFVTSNIAGLDDQMFSDTLFGHRKGAFTNANSDRRGQIERAANGSIFLDEIGDLSSQTQIKLLRLLQEREYYPLGSDVPRFTDALIILATNKDLVQMVEDGTFRKDLYYRLNIHHITPIPLRERLQDLPYLVDYFLEKAASDFGKKKPTVPPELFTLLSTHNFPGNIRELEGMVYDAVGTHKSKIMSLTVFKKHIAPKSTLNKVKHNDLLIESVKFGENLPTLKGIQSVLVDEALKRSNNNQSIAAQILGVTRQALNRRIIQGKKELNKL